MPHWEQGWAWKRSPGGPSWEASRIEKELETARTTGVVFLWKTEQSSQKTNEQLHPVKGGRQSIGARSPPGSSLGVVASHHRASGHDCCEDL
jgi:hypothetical protein